MQVLLNFLAFQVGWFSSVLGAAKHMPWIGPLVVIAIAAFHLRQARRPDLEAGLIVSCGVIGLFFDSLLVSLGWVAYPSGYFNTSFAPYWIVTMWMLFATTLNLSMGWLKGRPSLAALLGAVAGPLSYLGGQKLGGMQFVEQTNALIFLSVGWAVMMPIIMTLAERLDGFRVQAVPSGERQ
jgi:hypothetical protein